MDIEKIAINSLDGLIHYIMEHDLDETKKNELREMKDTMGLHFSLGMYIRNHYELSDENRVPHLIQEFKIMWVEEFVGRSNQKDEETRDFYEFLFRGMPIDDEMSSYIVKMIWKKVREE